MRWARPEPVVRGRRQASRSGSEVMLVTDWLYIWLRSGVGHKWLWVCDHGFTCLLHDRGWELMLPWEIGRLN